MENNIKDIKNIKILLERIKFEYKDYLTIIDLKDIDEAIKILNTRGKTKIVDIQPYTEQCISHGRKEVWNLIKEIYKIDYYKRTDFLGIKNAYIEEMLDNMAPEDVIEKFNKWKDKNKNEFEQGDKIYCKVNNSYGVVVTYKFDSSNEFHVIWDDGSVDTFYQRDIKIDGVEKTGEKIDLSELFNKLKGGDKNANKE